MTIKDLIEKRAKVWDTAKNFVETHEDKNGVLSDEDTATYNKMEKEIEAAYERARTLTPQDGIILCCGSLYMIGAMRTYLKHRKNS